VYLPFLSLGYGAGCLWNDLHQNRVGQRIALQPSPKEKDRVISLLPWRIEILISIACFGEGVISQEVCAKPPKIYNHIIPS
jgi:hypothetical protein